MWYSTKTQTFSPTKHTLRNIPPPPTTTAPAMTFQRANPAPFLSKKEALVERCSKYIKLSGIITMKKKPPVRLKVISIDIFLVFLVLPRYLDLYPCLFIQSRDEILFRRVGCDSLGI